MRASALSWMVFRLLGFTASINKSSHLAVHRNDLRPRLTGEPASGMAQPPDVSIARAVFTAAMMKGEGDMAAVSRDDVTVFAKTLLKTCNICTNDNMKVCSDLMLFYFASYEHISLTLNPRHSCSSLSSKSSFSPHPPALPPW